VKYASTFQTTSSQSSTPHRSLSSSSMEFLPAHLQRPIKSSFLATSAAHLKLSTSKLFYAGKIDMKKVSAVHPARNEDPCCPGLKGTKTLRSSRDGYNVSRSFSLVLADDHTLDLEAETEGEYWLIFRGFLHLQREVANGRMAAQRSKGIGSHYTQEEQALQVSREAEEASRNA